MNVMRALIGVHGFQVLRMAHDVIADLDAVADRPEEYLSLIMVKKQ